MQVSVTVKNGSFESILTDRGKFVPANTVSKSKAGPNGPEEEGNVQKAEEDMLAPVQSPGFITGEVYQGDQ